MAEVVALLDSPGFELLCMYDMGSDFDLLFTNCSLGIKTGVLGYCK